MPQVFPESELSADLYLRFGRDKMQEIRCDKCQRKLFEIDSSYIVYETSKEDVLIEINCRRCGKLNKVLASDLQNKIKFNYRVPMRTS